MGHLYQQLTSDGVVNASVQVLVRSRSGVQKGIFGFRHHHSRTLEKRTFRKHSMDSNFHALLKTKTMNGKISVNQTGGNIILGIKRFSLNLKRPLRRNFNWSRSVLIYECRTVD